MQDPQQPTPQQQAQVQANVAKMRASGASEDDVGRYLAHESGQLAATAPAPESATQGFGRAMLQHGLFNFGDELGLVNQQKQDAWAKNHPIADFLATIGGGAAAPIAAVFAAPELATLGGAAALGGVAGLISGAGEQDPNDKSPGQMVSRSNQAASQGIGGALGGVAGHLLSGVAGKVASGIADKMNPARVVARNAAPLLDGVQARMDAINTLAPGGASIANSAAPAKGLKISRFTTAVSNGVGQSPPAAAQATGDLLAQSATLKQGLEGIGAKIKANEKVIPVTPEVRAAISQARGIIGSYAPPVPGAPPGPGPTVPGFEPTGFSIPPDAEAVTTTELHDALSRMRTLINQPRMASINAPGQTKHDISQAITAMKKVLYKAAPNIEPIDQQYSAVANQLRTTEPLVKAAQRSANNYAGTAMTSTQPSPIGTNPVPTKHSLITGLTNKLFVDGKATAPEIARYITAPGGSDAVAKLLAQLPAKHPVANALTHAVAMKAGAGAGGAMKGLLEPEEY